MVDLLTEARKRQLARLGGAKPPAPRAAIALAKSQAYQDSADAPATLRPTQPISRTTGFGVTGMVSSPCQPRLRWLGPTWRQRAQAWRPGAARRGNHYGGGSESVPGMRH